MANSQKLDDDRPTRDALAGFYVEARDSIAKEVAAVNTQVKPGPGDQTVPRAEELFGFTVTLEDGITVDKPPCQRKLAER